MQLEQLAGRPGTNRRGQHARQQRVVEVHAGARRQEDHHLQMAGFVLFMGTFEMEYCSCTYTQSQQRTSASDYSGFKTGHA